MSLESDWCPGDTWGNLLSPEPWFPVIIILYCDAQIRRPMGKPFQNTRLVLIV